MIQIALQLGVILVKLLHFLLPLTDLDTTDLMYGQ